MPSGMSESSPSPAPGGMGGLGVEAAAAIARQCGLTVSARSLASWTGPQGRRVTPSGALSPADVPAAAEVLGFPVKPPVRRAADVPQVHRGWLMALGSGLVRVASGRARPAGDPAPAGDGIGSVIGPGDVGVEDVDEQVLAGWLAGVLLICTDASGRRHPQTLQWLVLLTLQILDGPECPQLRREYADHGYALLAGVRHALHEDDGMRRMVDDQKLEPWLAPPYPRGGDCRLLGLLTEAGAVRGPASHPEMTAAGRWLAARLREQAPVRILSDWSAPTVLEHLRMTGTDGDLSSLAADWCWGREPVEAARQLLGAAADADAATRGVAVRLVASFGEQALPAWKEVLASDSLGAHARRTLSWWEQGPGPRDGDRWWLGVEAAAAALPGAGPDEALSFLADAADRTRGDRPDARQLLAAVAASGHPQAEQVAAALTEFLASDAPRSIEHQLDVTVRLSRWRPATWRRVLIPATDSLGTLAWTIAVLFGWGFDHLHVFEIGLRRYTDAFYPLEGADDEDDARLSRLFATGARRFGYTYDLGACWEHEIVLERLVATESGQPTLRCVAYAGDSPLEYPVLEDDDGNPIDDPVVTRPFRLDKVNATLASGHYDVDDEEDEA
jgi:hypothetical protein